jgi:hypothetical protein
VGNGRHASGVVLVVFRGPEWWMHVRRPRTKVVAVAAATAATRRWTGGARGRGVGSVWGTGGMPVGSSSSFSGGPSGGGAFVAHTPKSSPSTPPSPPLIGGRTVRAVVGSGRCGGTDGGVVLVFQGARVAFVAHTPKSSLSTPPPPSLIGGRTVRAVEGSGRCGGTDGGVVLVVFRCGC